MANAKRKRTSFSFKKFILLPLILILALAGAGLFYLLYQDPDPPVIELAPESGLLGGSAEFKVRATDPGSGVKSLIVAARQGDRVVRAVDKTYFSPARPAEETVSIKDFDLQDGPFTLIVEAVDDSFTDFGKGVSARLTREYRLDLTPPKITLLVDDEINAWQGGSVCAAYTVSEEVRYSGVWVERMFFPAYKRDDGRFICFFPFPYFLAPEKFHPIITATDQVGARGRLDLKITAHKRDFAQDDIQITDGFLESKMPQFVSAVPGELTLLERFLKVNRDLRAQAAKQQAKLSRTTRPEKLWSGPFIRMPGAMTTARFADHRSYIYKGEVIDQQHHMGFDLASVRNAPVPAANSGRVAFAGRMNIYGRLIIIDHGFGLMSIYSHLSRFAVKVGQMVEKGQAIGLTGETGLAGGDHLHFGIMISGMPVTPAEWWDAEWIDRNILPRLK